MNGRFVSAVDRRDWTFPAGDERERGWREHVRELGWYGDLDVDAIEGVRRRSLARWNHGRTAFEGNRAG